MLDSREQLQSFRYSSQPFEQIPSLDSMFSHYMTRVESLVRMEKVSHSNFRYPNENRMIERGRDRRKYQTLENQRRIVVETRIELKTRRNSQRRCNATSMDSSLLKKNGGGETVVLGSSNEDVCLMKIFRFISTHPYKIRRLYINLTLSTNLQ